MTIQEFIAAAKDAKVTKAQFEELKQSLKEAEKQFEQEARNQSAGPEFLARTYSL